jgi:tetratricopeptide (TPR) repeat protein
VIEVASGRERHCFEGLEDQHFLGLGFSPDGRRLALAGGESQTLLIWDLADGDVLVRTKQAPPLAMHVAFSPDGTRLVVAARLQVKLLDAATGDEVLVLRGLPQMVPNSAGFNASVRFSPDGERLLAICQDCRWGLAEWWAEETGGSAAEQTARRLEAARQRGVVRLLGEEVLRDQQLLAYRHHYEHVRAVPVNSPWKCLARAQMHCRMDQGAAAVADASRAVQLAPDDGHVSNGAGHVFARHARWDQAAAAFAQTRRSLPEALYGWLHSVDTALAQGNREGCLRLCREMVRQFGHPSDSTLAEHIALRCLMLGRIQDLGVDHSLAGMLADRPVREPGPHPDYLRYVLIKARIEQSAGRFEAARDWLAKGEAVAWPKGQAPDEAIFLLFDHALVEAHLGRAESAREFLKRTTEAQDRRWPQADRSGDLGDGWCNWVHCQALRREVEALVNHPQRTPSR